MFQAETSETFGLIVTAGIAAPTIDVIVPSQRKSLREVLEPHLGNLTENHIMALTRCRPGSDYFSVSLRSGRRVYVMLRKRVVQGNKIYCEYVMFEEDRYYTLRRISLIELS